MPFYKAKVQIICQLANLVNKGLYTLEFITKHY